MRNNNKGAVLPLVAIILAFVVVCVALTVDLGHYHSTKIQLQRAVDAAAIAAARELNGDPDQNIKAVNAAQNIIALNRTGAATPQVDIELGDWDENSLEKANYQRFRPTNDNPDSAKVSASIEIEPVFNLFGEKSTIKADAIADNISKPVVIPLAVVSCVPTGADDIMTPGEDICDLSLLRFANATSDNAGWTSLTITPASGISPTYFTNPDPLLTLRAIDLFNRIVFGNEEQSGLETAPITNSPPCSTADNVTPFSQIDPVFLTGENEVSCGLGDEADINHLPRWYNTDEILDIATQKGLLSQDIANDETLSEYHTRLTYLYQAAESEDPYIYIGQGYTVPDEISIDGRFTRYIDISKKTVNFWMPIEDAGYPSVEVTNGVTNVVDALKVISVGDNKNGETTTFKKYLSAAYQPFDTDTTSQAKGNTILMTLPVIWSKTCDENFTEGYYVGTANFLMTRLWETPNKSYDYGSDSLLVSSSFDNSKSCSDRLVGMDGFFGPDKNNFVLPDWTGNKLTRAAGFETKTIEGILLDPTKYPQKDEIKKGINRLVIVE